MAKSGGATGSILIIPPSLLKDIEKADKAFDKLQEKSIQTRKVVERSFELMALGVDPFLAQLKAARENMQQIAKPTKEVGNDAARGFDRASTAVEHTNKHTSKLLDTTSQLQRQIALAFSVTAIEKYLEKVVSVRSQMELQQIALRAIIQDKDTADKIFSQTKNLALQSPFRVEQLVTYTKQLAAYRIESDKLYDTTKRLADVSAGLGVDMQRLILAYGQVKAAAYLRGTEVRQFTEAGVNLYGELQKYFEEVKGEAYTTAQIVDMISKRKILFEDIDAIFKRLTENGGMFYNMQEKQSETMYGQIQKTKDALFLMLDSIGKSNEGLINGSIEFAQDLIRNWRTIASLMKIATVGFISYKAVAKAGWLMEAAEARKIIGVRTALLSFQSKERLQALLRLSQIKMVAAARDGDTLAINRETAAQERLNVAMKTNPWGAAIGAVLALGVAIHEIVANMQNLDKELENIKAEGAFSAATQASDYKRLASIVADGTKSYKEHSEALAELKRKYSDILPEQYLNEKGIKELKGNYDDATQSIYSYIEAKTRERQIEALNSDLGKDLADRQKTLAEFIKKQIDNTYNVKSDLSLIKSSIAKLNQELQDGSTHIENARDRLKELLTLSTGFDASKISFGEAGINTNQYSRNIDDYFDNYIYKFNQLNEKINEINNSGANAFTAKVERDLNKTKEKFQKIAAQGIEAIEVLKQKQNGNNLISEEDLQKAKDSLKKVYAELGLDAVDFNNILNDSFKLNDETIKLNTAFLAKMEKAINDMLNAGQIKGGDKAVVQKYLEKMRKEAEAFAKTPMQSAVENFIHNFEKLNNINLSGFSELLIGAEESTEDFVKRMRSLAQELNQSIINNGLAFTPEYGKMSTEQINGARNEANAATAIANYYEQLTKEEKKNKQRAASGERDIWNERIKVLQEMHTKYSEVRKYLNAHDSAEMIKKHYSDALKEVGMSKAITDSFVPTKQGLYDALDKLANELPKKLASKRKEIERTKAQIKIEIDKDNLQKELDKAKRIVDEAFQGLTLHTKLYDMGMYHFEIEKIFPGLTATVEQLREKIQSAYKISPEMAKTMSDEDLKKFLGEDIFKAYISDRQRLEKSELDHRRNTMEQLVKDYKNQLTNQLQIDVWYNNERKKIYDNISDAELAKEMGDNLKKQYDKKTSEQAWKDFQGSEYYLMVFENLEYVSRQTLENMRARLEKVREELKALDPAQLKAITEQMNRLDEQLNAKSMGNLVSSLKEAFEFSKKRKEIEDALAKSEDARASLNIMARSQQEAVNKAKEKYDWTIKQYQTDASQGDTIAQDLINKAKQHLKTLQDELKVTLDRLVAEGKISAEYAKQIQLGQQSQNKAVGGLSKFNGIYSAIQQQNATIIAEWDQIFGTASDELKDFFDVFQKIEGGFGEISQGAENFVQGYFSGNAVQMVQGIAQSVSGTVKVISGIFSIGDKKKERQIKKLKEEVENLSEAYEKLKENMDKAWDMTNLVAYSKATQENLKKTAEAYDKMAQLEEDKKKKDKDKIKEYKQAAEDARKSAVEAHNKFIQELGGISEDDFKATAQSFADSWVDATLKAEDSIKALQTSLQDMMKNLLKKQVMQRFANQMLDPVFKKVNDAVEKYADSNDTQSMWEEIGAALAGFTEKATQFNEFGQRFIEEAKRLGIDFGTESQNLSALQQGIQGITEEQASALESLANSIRFFNSSIADNTSRIYTLLQERLGSIATTSTEDSPTLRELRNIANINMNIRRTLDSIVTYSGGGAMIKVKGIS